MNDTLLSAAANPLALTIDPARTPGPIGSRQALPPGVLVSRQTARKLGMARYRTGLACSVAGHVGERYTASGACCQCIADKRDPDTMAERRDAHAERIRQRAERMGREIVTRAEARLAGVPTYYSGLVCRHGHLAPRWTATAICCTCMNEHNRRNKGRYR